MPLLIALWKAKQKWVQAEAANAVISLDVEPQHSHDAIVAAGIVRVLITLLTTDEAALQLMAERSLKVLASGSQQSRDAIITAGALGTLGRLWLS